MKKKRLLTIVLMAFLSATAVNADSFFDKPLPICSNIQSYLAYEISLAVKSRCDNVGVSMTIKDLHQTFNSMLTSDDVSPEECNQGCLLLGATKGMSMSDCVKNVHVAPFVQGMMDSGVYSQDNCNHMRSRLN
ncbi:hypothetical protein [Nitrincola alkalisediminis]|uniref:Uncharacterized protein n=1 Tax=Nitrincola nitratireducens TaxID=1229521 RepID=W9UWH2_9GAMM|nr:hypothetical protein [Nitrincola alkalisediminis]EXJ11404.1 hypothetical protein D791_01536 [Nitrincola nitratireducens]